MADLQSKFNSLLEGKIDFEGQQYAEQIMRYCLIAISVVSFFIGLILQDVEVLFIVFGISTAILMLVVVPPWSYLNQSPIRWLPTIKHASDAKKTS